MLRVISEGTTGAEREKEVDDAIQQFDEYSQKVLRAPGAAPTPLTRFERASIKTFCAFMLGLGPSNEAKEGEDHGTTSSG